MFARYSLREMADRFTVQAQWEAVREVELMAVQARSELGQVSPDDLAVVTDRTPSITPEIVAEIAEREEVTDHDVGAFVDVMQIHIDHLASRWLHYGLTSADVTDTAICFRLVGATDLLIKAAEELLATLCERSREFAETPTAGRTHGQHAEVITYGVRLTSWALMIDRALKTLRDAREEIAVGKLSGACGTYSNIDPRVEEIVCANLGLVPITATQVVPRDLHAHLIYACTRLGNAIGHISFNTRIMAATEFGEVEEARRPGQKGSSAMPHKHNPIKTEQFDGLARVMRGYLASTLEQVQLLFERDISHSAPERIVLADAMILIHYMTVTAERVLRKLVVHPERMQTNIDGTFGLMFTQSVLTEMIDAGWKRDPAYRLIQELAERAYEEGRQFRALLEESPDVHLTPAQLDHAFDQGRMLEHIPEIIDRLPV